MTARIFIAETLGTALLMAVVIGVGIMAPGLFPGQAGAALLTNALTTGLGLFVLIQLFAPISGAHFNPAVSVVLALDGKLPWSQLPAYLVAQVGGAILGVWLTHAMFDLPILQLSTQLRPGLNLALSEAVATFGLILIVMRAGHLGTDRVAAMVGAYICAGYWFTASTGFANPAGTIARLVTDTAGGIAPASAPGYLLGEAAGAVLALALGRWLFRRG